MIINLPADQELWLKAQVEQGQFASIDDAVRAMIAEHMALATDDLAWAKPLLEEGLAAVKEGRVISAAESTAKMKAHLESLKR